MTVLKRIAAVALTAAAMFSCSNGVMNQEVANVSNANGVVKEGYTLIGSNIEKISYVTKNGINLYEGDIAVADKDIFATRAEAESTRAAVTNRRLWPNKTVHYQIAPNVYSKAIIVEAMNRLTTKAGIKFIESANPAGYLEFIPDSGSWSYIGYVGNGKQQLALADWATVGTAVHEIMHALGVYHEQSRKDRDDHVTIHFNNIKAGMEGNFRKNTGTQDYDIGAFDFNSIMLYGPTAFSINGQPTITKKDGSTYRSQRSAMSATDIEGIKYLYPGSVNPGDTQAPTVPAGLRSTGVTSNSLSVSWNASSDNVGVTSYKVYVNGTFNKAVSSTSATITALSSSTSYSVAVSAVDAAGNESAKSTAITVKTDAGSTTGGTAWAAGVNYNLGDVVTYNGSTYVCTMAHGSLTGWEPGPATAALWRLQ